MENPTVSVVMPVYNAAGHVTSAIKSILVQSMTDFELIVIDDGSTDETPAVVDSFDDGRIRLVRLEENVGIAAACNRGLEEARGEYVARHDADDRSRPDRFERQLEFLEDHDNVAAGVGTGARLVDESGAVIGRRHVPEEPSLHDIIDVNHFVHGAMMLRRSALEEVGGYDEWFWMAEDFELWLRLATEFELRNIDEPLYELRIHEESAYGSQLEVTSLYGILAAKKVTEPEEWGRLKEIADNDGIRAITEHLSRRERTEYHYMLAGELLRYGQPRAAREHVRRAVGASELSPMLSLLYALSFAPPAITEFTASVYRRLVVNPRLQIANVRRDVENLPLRIR